MVNNKIYVSIESDDNVIPESEAIGEFNNFFVDEMKKKFWTEKYLLKLLLKMHKAATSEVIKNAFENYLSATECKIERLEQIFEILSENPKANKCEAMVQLLDEVYGIIDETEKGSNIRDGGLIIAAQKVVNYEMASYETLIQCAKKMGNEDIIGLLSENLLYEIATGDVLNTISEKIAGEVTA